MEFRKSPQELIDAFEAAMPGAPAVKRPMFGYPGGFVNGNMFMGVFADKKGASKSRKKSGKGR